MSKSVQAVAGWLTSSGQGTTAIADGVGLKNESKKGETMDKKEIRSRIQEDYVEICEVCANVFRVERLKESEDWNDFGFRYCPYCGNITDEYANIR